MAREETSRIRRKSVPFDLVEEILCRLPVINLVQLRCVSKSWNSLISADSKFARKHLRLSISNQERHHLIRVPSYSPEELVLCNCPISSIFTSASTTNIKQFKIGKILNTTEYDNGASSICDGLVFFKLNKFAAVLSNPSIRKFKILPLNFSDQYHTLHTLVYDRFINNYKIIAVNWTRKNKIELTVHTLGTDYWRRIQDFPGPPFFPKPGVFLGDSVNWLPTTHDGIPPFIVSLDLEKESYQNLSLPVFDVITSFMILGTLKGSLSLLSQSGNFFDIWIMKEYGNDKSWIKLFTVPNMKASGVVSRYTKLLYISKNDQVLMEFIGSNIWSQVVYDSINNTMKIPNFFDNSNMPIAPQLYVESLISPF